LNCVEGTRKLATILIIEDSKFALFRLTKLFQGAGHEIVGSVRQSEKALSCYKTLQPQLVTLDHMMDGKSGEEVLEEIMDYDPSAKVIMISGSGDVTLPERVLNAGASAFVQKFDDSTDILDVIDQVLSR